MAIRPLNGLILLRPKPAPTDGAVIVTAVEKKGWGEVLDTPPNLGIAKGDTVYYNPYMGDVVAANGEELVLIEYPYIYGVLEYGNA